jgi:hypothetical protein
MTGSRRIVGCLTCGQQRPNQARGQCSRCYQNDPALVRRCAERLAARLNPEPNWWIGFGEFLAERAAATRAVSILHRLATALDRIGTATPTAVLEAIRNPGPAVGELARALEAYFVESGLALALDTTAQAAAEPRSRRLAEITDQFRRLAAAFDTHQLQRALFRRWTHDTADLHPHEPVIGLLGLLHGALCHRTAIAAHR